MTAGASSSIIDQIAAHAVAGTVATFLELDDSEPLPPYDDSRWDDFTVSGDDLAALLTDPTLKRHHKGVRIVGLRIEGDLDLDEATLDRPLMLRRCQFGTNEVHLRDADARAINLSGSRCGGITAEGATVTRNLVLGDGFSATGELCLVGTNIGGELNCAGANLANLNGRALNVERAVIANSVFLGSNFSATGEIRLFATKIGSHLNCSAGANLTNLNGPALTADGAVIAGAVLFSGGFSAIGEIRLVNAKIGGPLSCRGATLVESGGDALNAGGAVISGGVFLDARFQAIGEVCLDSAQFDNLTCRGGTFIGRNGAALAAAGALIMGGVFLDEGFSADGLVDLTNVQARRLTDWRTDWPTRMLIGGFRYESLESDARGWEDRREWLRRQAVLDLGAYLHLASVYRATGDDVAARKILMERHNALIRRDRPEHWEPHLPTGLRRWWRRVLGVTIGHGYEPLRVLYFFLPVLLLMSLWYARADQEKLLTPTDGDAGVTSSECTSRYPCFQPFFYAVDTVVPIVDLGQRSRWSPDVSARGSLPFVDDGRRLALATWLTTILGWFFATLIVAGFSNVIRRE